MTTGVRAGGGERIAMLDVLRGAAILGILFLNIPFMAAYGSLDFEDPRLTGSWSALDQWAFGAAWMIEGTMRGLLQLLFGAGMMIALRHTMRADGPVGPLDSYMRRNLWLIAFGLVHALVFMWPGDILLIYGLTALVLPPFRLLRPLTQLLIGAAITVALVVGGDLGAWREGVALKAAVATADAHRAAGRALTTADDAALARLGERREARSFPATGEKAAAMASEARARRGSFAAYWRFSVETWAKLLSQGGIVFELPESLGAMLVGAALFSWGVITGRRSSGFYWRLMLGCYAVGFGVRAAALAQFLQFATVPGDPVRVLVSAASDLVRLPIVVGHVALVALLLRSRAAGLARPLAANGVLPLTTYIGASLLVGDLVMPGYAGDQWGRHGVAAIMAIAAGVIAFQCAGANLWLRAGSRLGRSEWLWKTLAYARPQPWRVAAATPRLDATAAQAAG